MNTQLKTLDGNQLKKIGHASRTAEVLSTSLALRERVRHSSDIARMKNQLIREGETIVDSELFKFWKDLQNAGVGSVIVGRRGKPTRFDWHVSMKSVAKALMDGTNEKAERISNEKPSKSLIKPSVAPVSPKAEPKVEPSAAQAGKIIYISLRKDLELEINIPANAPKDFKFKIPTDLTLEEMERITATLKRVSG